MESTREKLRKYYEKNAFTKNTMFGFDDVVEFAEIHAKDVTTSQQHTIERLREALENSNDILKECSPKMGYPQYGLLDRIARNEDLLR